MLSGDRWRCTSSWKELLVVTFVWRATPMPSRVAVATGPPLAVIDQTACGIAAVSIVGRDEATAAGAVDTGGGAGNVGAGALAAAGGGSVGAGGGGSAVASASVDVAAAIFCAATSGPTWSRTRFPASQPIDLSRAGRSAGTAIVRDTTGAVPARSDIRISRGPSATSNTSAAPSPVGSYAPTTALPSSAATALRTSVGARSTPGPTSTETSNGLSAPRAAPADTTLPTTTSDTARETILMPQCHPGPGDRSIRSRDQTDFSAWRAAGVLVRAPRTTSVTAARKASMVASGSSPMLETWMWRAASSPFAR